MVVRANGLILEQGKDDIQNRINLGIAEALSYLVGQEIEIGNTGVVANTNFTVQHSLGRVPDHVENLIPANASSAGTSLIYPGTTAWTASTITLRCTRANAALKIRIR